MTDSEVTFAVFDALLREAGFTRTEEPDGVVSYLHGGSDTIVLVRVRDPQARVPWGTVASTRKILDGRGVLAGAAFDQRVLELGRTLGMPQSAARAAPQRAVRRPVRTDDPG